MSNEKSKRYASCSSHWTLAYSKPHEYIVDDILLIFPDACIIDPLSDQKYEGSDTESEKEILDANKPGAREKHLYSR